MICACLTTCSRNPPHFLRLCTAQVHQECRTPQQFETLLIHPDLRIVGSEETKSGGSGARVLTLALGHGSDELIFRAKWRSLDTTSGSNSPRKELVAYFAQSLFLDQEDYVFPPTRGRCFELQHYRRTVDPNAAPTFPDESSCVFGIASLWLEESEAFEDGWFGEEKVFVESRWANDPVYRKTLANGNLLAYLISNGDTHNGNWIKVQTPKGTRLYLVDASISLTRMGNPSLGPDENFVSLLAPALDQRSVQRLLELERDDLRRLFSVERFAAGDSMLRPVNAAPHPSVEGTIRGSGLEWFNSEERGTEGRQLVVGLAPHELLLVEKQLWYLELLRKYGELEFLGQGDAR